MTIRLKNQLNRLFKLKASIGSFYHKHGISRGRGRERGGSYSSKGRGGHNHGVTEQNSTGSNHNPSSNNSWHGGRVRENVVAENVVTEDEETFIINQMWSVITAINATIMQMSADKKVIIMLSIVLKKIVITNKMKRIMQY